ncbi:MAG: hypothetical protein AAGJ08_06895 [Cyanobacteria bacterium P01_H01_bin.35]
MSRSVSCRLLVENGYRRDVCGAFRQEKGGNNYEPEPKFNFLL